MDEFLQVQVEFPEQRLPKELHSALSKALEATLQEIGMAEAYSPSDVQVKIERPASLAVETAVIIALIGLSIKLIDLIMFLIKHQDEAKKLGLEKAKIEAQRASEIEKQRWRQEFVEQILLARVLARANVQPVNVVVQVIQQ